MICTWVQKLGHPNPSYHGNKTWCILLFLATNAGRIVFRECTRPTPLIRAYEADPRIPPYGDVRHTKEMLGKVTSAIEMSRFLLSAHGKTKHQYCQSLQDNGHARWNNLIGINLWYQYLKSIWECVMTIIRIAHSWHHIWLYTITVSLFWCSSVLFELWLRTNCKRCRILEWHRTPKSWWRHQMETFSA